MNAFSKTAVETHVLRLAESRRSRSTESMFYGCICSHAVFSGSSLFFELFSKRRDFETYQDCLYIDSLAQSDTATNALASPPSFAAPIAGRWLLASLPVSAIRLFVIASVAASLQTMSLTSVDRYFRVVQPMKYRILHHATRSIDADCVGLVPSPLSCQR